MSKYVLGAKPQLIDLNRELVNFSVEFEVMTKGGEEEIELLVITQDNLNEIQDLNELNMKKVVGGMKGKVTYQENTYKNYFLVLRGKPGTECEVQLHLEELPAPEQPQSLSEEAPVVPTPTPSHDKNAVVTTTTTVWYKNVWLWILVLVLLISIGYYLYSTLYTKQESMIEKEESGGEVVVVDSQPVAVVRPTTTASTTTTSTTAKQQRLYKKMVDLYEEDAP